MTTGWVGGVMRYGAVGAGMAMPMTILGMSRWLSFQLRKLALVAAPAMTLIGVFALRYSIVVGGRLSADDPLATFAMTE